MEHLNAKDKLTARLISNPALLGAMMIKGVYKAECRDKDGNLKWTAEGENHVTTEGINFMLDTLMAGSGYSVTGPYMGLISSVSYSTTAITDVAAQIGGTNGWEEASSSNAPDYSGNRKTCAWDAADAHAISLSAALAFTFTEGGTVKGAFIVLGTGASATKENTSGKLFSAGVFSGGDKVVADTDILNVSYTVTITDT